MKIFEVMETFHGYQLVHLATGLSKCLGDGVDQFVDKGYDGHVGMDPERNSSPAVGTEQFRADWEREVNVYAHIYFQAYFSRLDDLVVFDSNREFVDRYTVVIEHASPLECSLHAEENLWVCLGLSEGCDSPGGFSQWGFVVLPNEMIGEKVHFLELPVNVQKHIVGRLEESKDG